jgi:pyruvate ferredoxin oxidoreductase gamma subunit/2-oxoisovalerate ferredoxin oxidoreductase gamma subunit
MMEVKISGRGGQGVVLASQILASAFFEKGMYVQAFPSFGAERRGAPVSAFLRTDSREITLRHSVRQPDWLIVFDAHLLHNPMVMGGVGAKTSLLLNVPEDKKAPLPPGHVIFAADATGVAEKLSLKSTSFPIVNTAMVGAFARAAGLIDLERVLSAIREVVPVKKDDNVEAARLAYESVRKVQ